MWLELCFAIISCIFLLYVPGLIGAASWSSRIDETVAFAPIISVTSYCFAGLVLSLVGVFASAATIIPFALAWCPCGLFGRPFDQATRITSRR